MQTGCLIYLQFRKVEKVNYLVRYLVMGLTLLFLTSCGIKGPLYIEESQDDPSVSQNSEQQSFSQEQNQ
ncbi:MAG: lipoprotein [Succinivibrio sp.]